MLEFPPAPDPVKYNTLQALYECFADSVIPEHRFAVTSLDIQIIIDV